MRIVINKKHPAIAGYFFVLADQTGSEDKKYDRNAKIAKANIPKPPVVSVQSRYNKLS